MKTFSYTNEVISLETKNVLKELLKYDSRKIKNVIRELIKQHDVDFENSVKHRCSKCGSDNTVINGWSGMIKCLNCGY